MTNIKITTEQVKKMSKLAKLNVLGDEEKLAEMFTDTLDKIRILEELDTSKTNETFQVTGLTNVFQDKNTPNVTLSKPEAMQNASETRDGLFCTKGVFERSI